MRSKSRLLPLVDVDVGERQLHEVEMMKELEIDLDLVAVGIPWVGWQRSSKPKRRSLRVSGLSSAYVEL